MRLPLVGPLAAAALAVGATVAVGQELEGWVATPDEGVKAARVSSRPILVVTCWRPDV